MKDNRLENEFEEYFSGVNISNDIIADAKKSVKPKSTVWPKVLKFASIAASIVLVFAITLTVMFTADFKNSSVGNMANGGSAPPSSSGDSSAENPGSSGDSDPSAPDENNPSGGDSSASPSHGTYTDSDITTRDESVNSLSSLHSSLKFIVDFAGAENTAVENCKSAYMDGKLAFVKTEISISDGLKDEQTAVYVEFTTKVYGRLEEFYDGDAHDYNGVSYYLTNGADNECKLLILDGGIKYYFDIHSSDGQAYRTYLNAIIK